MKVELTELEVEVEDDQDELTGSYTFDQLSDKAKDRAREAARDWNVDHDWWNFCYEDAVRMGALMGINIGTREHNKHTSPDICFSGFCSQGDGASYSGSYHCVPDAVAKIIAECGGNDKTIVGIAEALTVAQVVSKFVEGGELMATISMGHSNYCHSGGMTCEVSWQDGYQQGDIHDDQGLIHIFRRFADWIYDQLEAEYEHLTSNESIDEALKNGHLFDGDGDMI